MTHATRPWDAAVYLDGNSIYMETGGSITIKEVEGGNMTATLKYFPPVGAIDPNSWAGKPITIDIEDASQTVRRKFTGRVRVPSYDPITRVATLTCTQNRDELLSAYDDAGLATLIGGYWSKHIFDADADIPRKAEDRLKTVTAALNFDGSNTAVLTPWAAKATPDITLSAGEVLERSIAVELLDRETLKNTIDVKFKYRFTRLRHREHVYSWDYPGGSARMATYVADPTTLPWQDQIHEAIGATGLTLRPGWAIEPMGESGYYGGVAFWWKKASDRFKYALGADFTLARRFVQTITEDYTVTVKAPQSVTQYGEIKSSATYGVTAEYNADDWDELESYQSPPGSQSANGDYVQDKTESGLEGSRDEFDESIQCAVAMAAAEIKGLHRKQYVRFETQSVRPDLELSHTVQLNSTPVTTKGKLVELEHHLKIGDAPGWEAVTRCKLAVSKIENTAPTENPIAVPTAPDTSDAGPIPGTIVLGNHYGNHAASPAYDETWDGSIGNYKYYDAVQTMEIYPQAFIIDVPEVADIDRNERSVAAASTYDIEIPNETLSMN